jgi:hypothetical protein
MKRILIVLGTVYSASTVDPASCRRAVLARLRHRISCALARVTTLRKKNLWLTQAKAGDYLLALPIKS